jgi:tetratricopeptide (TPR) repeat protein
MDTDSERSGSRADLAWTRALDAYTVGAYTQAREEFRAAVRLDPGMADAWLGLHALKETPSQALLQMYRYRDRFGEQRRAHGRPLNSWYWLGWWVQPVLETQADLLLAHASHWLDGQHLTELDRALRQCPDPEGDPQARFLHACRCYLVKDWERLVRLTDPLLDDPVLGIEAGLFGGMARVRLGMCGPAVPLLSTSLVRCRSEVPQRKELRYWLARAYEATGRSAAALPLYRAVHEKDTEFMDTAARLAAILAEDTADGLAEEASGGPAGSGLPPAPSGPGGVLDTRPPLDPPGPEDGGQSPDPPTPDLSEVSDATLPWAPSEAPSDTRSGPPSGTGRDPRLDPLPGDLSGELPGDLPAAPQRALLPVVPMPLRGADAAVVSEQERLRAALGELEGMVGLEPVKRQVRALSAQLRIARLRAAQGLTVQPPKRHFLFIGPSGTGKTTVARILGRVFHALGLLPSDRLVEAHRADLVGEFLGQTALKAGQVIDSALGGVLFIDEAYSLANTGYTKGDAYGAEALQVLLKRAEDNRDRLVVILAGYPEGMDQLMASNPGLSSRFTTRVDFPSYGPSELAAIARVMAGAQGDSWDEESTEELRSICEFVVERRWVNRLGNGRFVRTLYETSCSFRDLRLSALPVEPDREELLTLRLEDLLQAYGECVQGET